MTARENALRIIKFDHPERVVAGPPAHVMSYRGCDHEGYVGGGHDCPVGTKWTDVWGTEWHKEQEGVMGFPRGNPLADPRDLKTYQWPEPDDPRICGQIYEMHKKRFDADRFLGGSHRETLWEKAHVLVGMENMMAAFYNEPEFARELLHGIMDCQLAIARHYLDLGVEMAFLSDDLGTQTGPLLSPSIVNEFLVPEYVRLFALYKEHGVMIVFHSCGHIEAFLELFMELGVDILNPVQANANDLAKVRSLTQGKMALQGGIGTSLVMEGPVDRITQEVRMRLLQLGAEGGYFCQPDHGLPFPQSHIDAFHQALETYGRYPLQPID
jgi:uroporphyrinogen decarboxylase